MNTQEIIDKVRSLQFAEGSYVVFGSCPLALAGLREAGDIDLLVSQELFESLPDRGWVEFVKNSNDKPLTYKEFEAHSKWDFSSYQPTLQQLLKTATIVQGVPFASLDEVRKWKLSSGRPKDLRDVKLIDSLNNT